MNKNNHGGQRKGAGRPKTNKPKIKTSITIDAELKKWADCQVESMSELANEGLKLIQKQRKNNFINCESYSCDSKEGKMKEKIIFPMQPMENYRFIPNRIVQKLLETSTLDMNGINVMRINDEITEQEQIQFAQLIGYSLSGFSELNYVDDETYEKAVRLSIKDLNND